MSTLGEISSELGTIVERVAPAVVRVEAGRRVPGSGIVWAADGTIVTADHVIEREDDIRVGLQDGRDVAAALVGRDPSTDVVVLRAQASGLAAPSWGAMDKVKPGHMVLALARPGRSVRARLGIISAVGEMWRAPRGGEIDRYVEADVALGYGFSGGPLLDTSGAALGMNTAGLLPRTAPALTVPVETLRRVVGALVAHGRIRRGYLGIGAHPVRLPERLRQPQGQDTGLIIVSIESGSPADRGGLQIGDVVVGLDGVPVRRYGDIQARLTAQAIGSAMTVRILRGGDAKDVSVTIGER